MNEVFRPKTSFIAYLLLVDDKCRLMERQHPCRHLFNKEKQAEFYLRLLFLFPVFLQPFYKEISSYPQADHNE